MYHREITLNVEEARVKVLEVAVREAIASLAEIHHQVGIIKEESSVVQKEYKQAMRHIEQSRLLLKAITL
jgi:hypothetical protein